MRVGKFSAEGGLIFRKSGKNKQRMEGEEGKMALMRVIRKGLLETLSGEKLAVGRFMSVYNAVYRFCTDEATDKYVIEGGQIYHMYDKLLIHYLEHFPEEFTVQRFSRYVDSYRRSVDVISKMMSFLTRYFIKVNVEVENTNIQDLQSLSYSRLYEGIVEGRAEKIHDAFLGEIRAHRQTMKHLEASLPDEAQARASAERARSQRTLNLFLREYLFILKVSRSRKNIKKFYARWSEEVLENAKRSVQAEQGDPQKRWYKCVMEEVCAIDSIFAREPGVKRVLYRITGKRMAPEQMKATMALFVSDIFGKGISRETRKEIGPGYLFIDSQSRRHREAFRDRLLLTVHGVIRDKDKCKPLLRLSIFVNKHMKGMKTLEREVRGGLDRIFARRVREIVSREDESTKAFASDLLETLTNYFTNSKPFTTELSLFAANISRSMREFWRSFVEDTKHRLICLGGDLDTERKMVSGILKRVERFKDEALSGSASAREKRVHAAAEPAFDPIDCTLFEDLHMCFNDIKTSHMYFRIDNEYPHVDSKLLSCNRWSYRKLNINLAPELERPWGEIVSYCRNNGRRYTLDLCPDVSKVVLEVGGVEVSMDAIDATVLLLVKRERACTRDHVHRAVALDALAPTYLSAIKESIDKLVGASILIEEPGHIRINPCPAEYAKGSERVELFDPLAGKKPWSLQEAATQMDGRYAIEHFVVKEMKARKQAAVDELFALAAERFPLSADAFEAYVASLQDRGFLDVEDGAVKYIP